MSEFASTATADCRYWNTGTRANSYSRWVAALLAVQAAPVGSTGCYTSRPATGRCSNTLYYAVRSLPLVHIRSSVFIYPSNWLTARSSWEANRSSACQEIPCTSWRPTIHCHFHITFPLVPNLSINPVHHSHVNFNSDVRHPAVLHSNWTHEVGVRPNTIKFYFMQQNGMFR